jgi:hypothetical protein
MNRLQLLQQQLMSAKNIPTTTYIDIDLPYNLKDICKIKFKGHIKWNTETESWSVKEDMVSNFDKIFLENLVEKPTKEQRLLLKQSGCNFCKDTKLWYMLKFQTEEPTPTELPDEQHL